MAALAVPAQSKAGKSTRKTEARFWTATALIMTFLGLNKQLDIQTLFTEIGRHFAHTGGWYDQRQTIQILFILVFSTLAILSVCAMFWLFRKVDRAVRTAAVGLCLLGTFVIVRAASFHHVDIFLGDSLSGIRWNGILELGGILIISTAAWQYRKNQVPKAMT